MWLIRVLLLKLMFIGVFQCLNGNPHIGTRSRSLPFVDCGSTYDLLSVVISSCEYSPCSVPLGNTVQVTTDFITEDHDTNSTLTHEGYWILNSINTRASISPESCDGQWCPFKSAEGLGFTADLLVNKTLPAVRGTLYWRVQNYNNKMVLCFKVPISINL